MPHNFKMSQASHEQLILAVAHNLTQILQTKNDTILTPIDADTREQLKLLTELFSRQHNQEHNIDRESMVLLPESKTAPSPKVKDREITNNPLY